MGRRTNWTLLVLAVLLTLYAYFFEAGSDPITQRGRVFPDLDPGDILEILLERPVLEKDAALGIDARAIRLRKEGTPPAWWIVEPFRFEAFHPRLQELAFDLAGLVRVAAVPAGEAPAAFARGVEARVSFKTREGQMHVLEVGAEHTDPKLQLVYCRLAGNGFVTERGIRQALLDGSINDFRSRALVGIAPQDVSVVAVTGDSRFEKKITRDGTSEHWRLVSPLAVAADRELVEELLRELNAWTIAAFHLDAATDADLVASGLAPPRGRVTVERLGGGELVSLEIGSELGDPTGKQERSVFLRFAGKPFVFKADAKPLGFLFQRSEELRSRYIFDLGVEEVDEIAYETTASRTILRRSRDKGEKSYSWGVLDAKGVQLFAGDRLDIEAQVSSLRRLLVHKFLPQDLGPPVGKLTLKTQGGRVLELHLGQPVAGEEFRGQNMYHATVPGEPGTCLVSTILVLAFEAGPISFRQKDISNLDPARLQEIRLISWPEVWSLARALPGDPWMLEADTPPVANKELNSALVDKLLQALHRDNFRLRRYAPEVDDFASSELELQSPRRALIVDRVEGEAPLEPRRFVLGIRYDETGETLARVDTAGVPPFLVERELPQLFDSLIKNLREVTGKE